MNTSKFVLLCTILSIIALSMAPIAYAQPPQQQPDTQASDISVVSKRVKVSDQRAALAFWTHDALAQAQPLEMIDYSGDSSAMFADESAAVGEPESSMAGFAAPNADRVARKFFAADWAADSQASAEVESSFDTAGTSQVFDSYNVNSLAAVQKIYPHKWVGRLSFKTSGGTSYCSATAISGNNFVTAAHCVYDTSANKWYSNWVFTPAYRAGNAPYGSFPGTVCTILTAWVNLSGGFSINGWSKYDVAVCTVGKNAANQTLNNAVGFAGRSWNYGYVLHHFDMGYPFRNTDNVLLTNAGAFLRTCASESFQQTTDTRGTGCNLGPGISGGPWLRGYQQNVVAGWVNGVNSGFFIGTDNMYGPRFTSNNIVPLCNARGC